MVIVRSFDVPGWLLGSASGVLIGLLVGLFVALLKATELGYGTCEGLATD